MTDELSITVNQQTVSGWEDIRLSRGIELFPSNFEIALTEKFPDNATSLVVVPGDACTVKIGNDVVLTGYVDRYAATITDRQHQIRILGRSKCEDLYDCSAIEGIKAAASAGYQFVNTNAITVAQALAKPFEITVQQLSASKYISSVLPVLDVNLTMTPYEIIEIISRYEGLLVYDGVDGNLILAGVGLGNMASGFAQGENVQRAAVQFSMDQRYSDYLAYSQSMLALQFGDSGNTGSVKDEGVKRHRPLVIICEQQDFVPTFVELRLNWERNRRLGRSQQIRLTCDSWRDGNGLLWTPNYFANVHMPSIKVVNQNWIISEVTYMRNLEYGTISELTLMPDYAFSIQPQVPPFSVAGLIGAADDTSGVPNKPPVGPN